MLAGSFSIGIDWAYWEKDSMGRDADKDLYVLPRFADLKSEIMKYEHLDDNINVYNAEINKKALQYHQTDIAKQTSAIWDILGDFFELMAIF